MTTSLLRVGTLIFAIALDLFVIWTQVDLAIGTAACFERAKYELILCVSPPGPWAIIASGGLAVALSIAVGIELGRNRFSREAR